MNLELQLGELEKTALIRRVQATEATWFFHQSLTQENIYNSLLRQPRRELHLAVARAIEQVYANELEEYAALLAEHYAGALDDAKTFEYSSRAGHAALRVYANAEAIAHFTRAIDAAKRLGSIEGTVLKDLFLHLGRALELSGHFQQALQNYEELETLAHQREDRAMQLAALIALATIHSTATVHSDATHARMLSNLALGLAREIGDRETEARVLWNLSLLHSNTGEMQPAIDYGEQSLAIAQELGMDEQIALTSNDLLRPYMSLGQEDRALSLSKLSRKYFRETGNPAMLADNLGRAVVINSVFGDFEDAIKASEEAREISERIGNPWGQSFSQMITGNIYFQRGEMSRAMATMRESIRLGEKSGFLFPQIWTRSELGAVFGELGDVKKGIELVNQAYAIAAERLPRGTSRIHGVLARLALMRGEVKQAESHVEQGKLNLANDFAQRALDQFPLVEIKVALAKQDYGQGLELADALLDSDSVFVKAFQSDLHFLKGDALSGRGDARSARSEWLSALTEAEKIQSRWMLWQTYAALGEYAQARALVEFIAQNAPSDLRGSFLALPNVRKVTEA